jgi:nucleoid-associated protein YgaU
MKKSAYIGLGALLALMVGLAFLVSAWGGGQKDGDPIDVSGGQAKNDQNAGKTNPDAGRTTSAPTQSAGFTPDHSATPGSPSRTLQIDAQGTRAAVTGATSGTRATSSGASPLSADPLAKQHTVQPGDNYYNLAEKYYGARSGRYADLIAKANPDKNPNKLRQGDILIIPPKPPEPPVKSSAQPAGTDTRPATSPRDAGAAPRPGQTTLVPKQGQTPAPGALISSPPPRDAKASKGAAASAGKDALGSYKTYVVKNGEGFRKIARTVLGDEKKWKALYELNHGLGLVKNENDLKPRQKIALSKLAD